MLLDIVATSGRQYWRTGNIKKKSRNCTNIKQSDVKLETTPEPQEGQPRVRSAALLRRPPSLRLHGPMSPNPRSVARTQRWAYFHPVSGFYSDPSLSVHLFYFKEEAGGSLVELQSPNLLRPPGSTLHLLLGS